MCIKLPVFGLAGKALGIGPKVSPFGLVGEAAERLLKKKKKPVTGAPAPAPSIGRREMGYRSLLD